MVSRPSHRSGPQRSEAARQAVLAAARQLVEESGYGAATVEAIAAAAGVGKPTIYRWWANRASVVMEAYLAMADAEVPFPDTGSAKEDFRCHLSAVAQAMSTHPTGTALAGLVGDAQHDPALAKAIAAEFIDPRRVAARQIVTRAVQRGELRADIDADVAIDALYGPLYYRLLVRPSPLNADFVDTLIAHVYPGLINDP